MTPFPLHPSVTAIRAMLERTTLGLSEERAHKTDSLHGLVEWIKFSVRNSPGAAPVTILIEKLVDGRIGCLVAEPIGVSWLDRPRTLFWQFRDSRSDTLLVEDIRAIRDAYDHVGSTVARLTSLPGAELPDPEALAESLRTVMEKGGAEAPDLVARALASALTADKAAEIMEALDAIAPSLGRTGP